MRRPSPRHCGQGSGIISPVPAHREHATLVTTCPSSDWRTRRSSPVPWQSTQVSGSVPGAVPRPEHAAHVEGRRTEISCWEPNTASSKRRSNRTSASEPDCGPWRRSVPDICPKKASKMSPSPPSKLNPPVPPGCEPNTPSGPKRS